MDFLALGKFLLDLGLPVVGQALGVPELGPIAADVLKTTLGLPSTASNDQIAATAKSTDPEVLKAAEATMQERLKTIAAIVHDEADLGKTQVTSVNEAIKAETQAAAARADGWWGNWRTVQAYELAAECPYWAGLIGYSIVAGKVNELVLLSGLIMTWWAARFGILGVHVWTGSNERQVAMTGAPAGGVAGGIGNLVKALTGKK